MGSSVCTVVLAATALSLFTPRASASGPSPFWSVIPGFVTIYPDGGGGGAAPSQLAVTVIVNEQAGPIEGALVEIEFSPEATALLAWSDPVPQYADVPTQYAPGRIYSKTTRADGSAMFWIAGGGCLRSEDLPGVDFIVQIRADGVVLGEREVNSPDVVDSQGRLCSTRGAPICDDGQMEVGMADAVFHSPFVASGSYEKCTDVVSNDGGVIQLGDAVVLAMYIKVGASAACYVSP